MKVTKAIISPVLLFGCETWPLAMKEEQEARLRKSADESIWT
jgi:hypothetical protein